MRARALWRRKNGKGNQNKNGNSNENGTNHDRSEYDRLESAEYGYDGFCEYDEYDELEYDQHGDGGGERAERAERAKEGKVEAVDHWIADWLKENEYPLSVWSYFHDHKLKVIEDFGGMKDDELEAMLAALPISDETVKGRMVRDIVNLAILFDHFDPNAVETASCGMTTAYCMLTVI